MRKRSYFYLSTIFIFFCFVVQENRFTKMVRDNNNIESPNHCNPQ